MVIAFLLSFLGGAFTVIYLEFLGLQALLAPFRDLISLLVPGS